MEVFPHDLNSLFSQLGLKNTPEFIEHFIAEHSLLPDQAIFDADFWLPAQKEFLRESHYQDADWCAVVNELDALLRKQ